jgi:betaine reductase
VVANLVTIAEQVGAPRIVPGRGIQHPSGDSSLPPAAERAWRRALLERALVAVATAVEKPTIFEVEEPADA